MGPLKRRTVAGRQAFEKAFDLAFREHRGYVRESDVEQILAERFDGAPAWEAADG